MANVGDETLVLNNLSSKSTIPSEGYTIYTKDRYSHVSGAFNVGDPVLVDGNYAIKTGAASGCTTWGDWTVDFAQCWFNKPAPYYSDYECGKRLCNIVTDCPTTSPLPTGYSSYARFGTQLIGTYNIYHYYNECYAYRVYTTPAKGIGGWFRTDSYINNIPGGYQYFDQIRFYIQGNLVANYNAGNLINWTYLYFPFGTTYSSFSFQITIYAIAQYATYYYIPLSIGVNFETKVMFAGLKLYT